MTITPEQSRAARALLNWSRQVLADASGVGRSTISKFERREHASYPRTLAAIQTALEAAGIIFIDNDEAAGVVLRHRDPRED